MIYRLVSDDIPSLRLGFFWLREWEQYKEKSVYLLHGVWFCGNRSADNLWLRQHAVLLNIPRKASASRLAMWQRNGSRSALRPLRKYLLCIYKVQQCCFEQRGVYSKGQRNKYDKAKRNFPPSHAPFLIYHCHTNPFRQQRRTQCRRKAVFHTKRCGKRLNLLTLVALSFPYFNAQALECSKLKAQTGASCNLQNSAKLSLLRNREKAKKHTARGAPHDLPHKSHSRRALLDSLAPSAPCFVVSRGSKTIPNRFCLLAGYSPSALRARFITSKIVEYRAAPAGKKIKPTTRVGFIFLVAGVGFEPHDLRVMSPTSCQTAPSRDIIGAGSRGRTGTRNKSHGILSPGRLPIPPFRHT